MWLMTPFRYPHTSFYDNERMREEDPKEPSLERRFSEHLIDFENIRRQFSALCGSVRANQLDADRTKKRIRLRVQRTEESGEVRFISGNHSFTIQTESQYEGQKNIIRKLGGWGFNALDFYKSTTTGTGYPITHIYCDKVRIDSLMDLQVNEYYDVVLIVTQLDANKWRITRANMDGIRIYQYFSTRVSGTPVLNFTSSEVTVRDIVNTAGMRIFELGSGGIPWTMKTYTGDTEAGVWNLTEILF